MTNFKNTFEFSKYLDEKDPLSNYQNEFYFPKINNKKVIYFTGNSLGLQPKKTQIYIDEVMNDWKNLGVEGHFYAQKPWFDYHERFSEPLSKIIGALPSEVSVMNTLTVNLHLLLISFYKPTPKRFKIICEAKAFPSDQYMLQSQLNLHGLNLEDALVEIYPRTGEHIIRLEDILSKIKEVGEELALVFMGGVNYYTGQAFDINQITNAGKAVGAIVGWDLAHAAGNINLELHNWNVDFAAWCSYKYMNSGPGNVSGYFVHEKHHKTNLPKLAGWWGYNKEKRFKMEPHFEAINNVNGWQISNPSVLSLAPYLASLTLFTEIGMPALFKKRDQLTAFLAFVIQDVALKSNNSFEIITPQNPKERGSQLSVLLHGKGKDLFDYLIKNGVLVDWREPNVIRLSPVPMYCSFTDIYNFGQILKQGIE